MSDYNQHVTTLGIQKLAAWAFAVGERPRIDEARPRPRPHRGQLPDVDFDRAIVDPNYRPLWLRLADFILGHGTGAPEGSEAETRAVPATILGERLATAYIGEKQAGEASVRATVGNSSQNSCSRAA
ncbi:hypothetical protein SAZ10_11050 [Mesorhizobium sp. BAC0120]|uniref:hypothetical protein n=1 Tax=Mesorhizobium sp. BAC0120 TaxID=3090670 RepID=UPI00298C8112|nr:hypothetical protein [Mesorhizobium sp. BAC0120]MDW6022289.1 hypothetical protein [Mesorhizobium sp. BAC0120]